MSKIRDKSEFNIEAAEKLIALSLYAPSIHCSYYSCYQLSKYTIKYFFGIYYATQSRNIASGKLNSHQYVLNYIATELKNLASNEDSRRFKRKIKDLKLFRVESDYENIEVNSEKGNKAFTKANEIRSYLIEKFKV